VSHTLPAIHPTIAIDCGDAVPHQPEFTVASATPSADHAVLDGALAMAWTAVAAATDDTQRERLLDGVSARVVQTSGPVVTDSAPVAQSAPRHRGERAATGGAA
jgi:hypothetical protein